MRSLACWATVGSDLGEVSHPLVIYLLTCRMRDCSNVPLALGWP